ncbi:hypothetical protein AB6A40_002097 [Gnathostoma spinigerum]|uniref:Uncharacterized protein n=1 Tax=Gnathostoma spinigerum TaxID=75299 RepID=A0ABD6EET1_9BILA
MMDLDHLLLIKKPTPPMFDRPVPVPSNIVLPSLLVICFSFFSRVSHTPSMSHARVFFSRRRWSSRSSLDKPLQFRVHIERSSHLRGGLVLPVILSSPSPEEFRSAAGDRLKERAEYWGPFLCRCRSILS